MMKSDGTGSTVSGMSFDEETVDNGSQASSYVEMTVADAAEHVVSQTHHHETNAADKAIPIANGKQKSSSEDVSSQAGNRARCGSNDSGFTLVLRPNLERDVSALTECLVPASPAFGKSSDHHRKPKGVQRKDSAFDLVVSNHSIPMSTLTMMEFSSPRGSKATGSVATKWLNSTPRNVDGAIPEDASADSFGSFGHDGGSPIAPVSLPKLKESSRDAKKKATKPRRSNSKEDKENNKASSKPKMETSKSGAAKGKISKPKVVTKQDSAHSSGSKSSTRRSSAAKGKISKPKMVTKQDSSHSSDSKSKPSSKSKKKKSSSITKSATRNSTRSDERDQPNSPKKGKTKESERDDPSTPDSRKSPKRRSKNKESRQDDSLSPSKSPKTRKSENSPRTPKSNGSRKSSKARSSKTSPRRASHKKTKSRNTSPEVRTKDPPGALVPTPSCMINNRAVPAIPIKPSVVTHQTSDSSSQGGFWSMNQATKSRFSTTTDTATRTTSTKIEKARMSTTMDAPPKSPSVFRKLRRSTNKARVR